MDPGPVHVVDPAVGQRHVDLDVVRLPLVADRLDADTRQPDDPALVPHPRVHGFPHLVIVRLGREHELEVAAQATRQIDRHVTVLPIGRRTGTDAR